MRLPIACYALTFMSVFGADFINQAERPVVVVQVLRHEQDTSEFSNGEQGVFKLPQKNLRAQIPADSLNVPTIYENKYDPNSLKSTAGMLLTPAPTPPANVNPGAVSMTPALNLPKGPAAAPAPTAPPPVFAPAATASLARASSTVLNGQRPMPPGVYNPPVTTTLSFAHPSASISRAFSTTKHALPSKAPFSRPYTTATHASTSTVLSSTVVVVITTSTVSSDAAPTGHQPSAEPTTSSYATTVEMPMTANSYTEAVASAQPGAVPVMATSTSKKESDGSRSDFTPWLCLSAWWLVIATLVLI